MICNASIAQQTQKKYWQQQTDYTITVKLNDTLKTLDGFETIQYYNHSPDTLKYLWFHLWPNAYKNENTAFTEQQLANGSTSFYFAAENEKGYINMLSFEVNDMPAKLSLDSANPDMAVLYLPTPLLPKGNIKITSPFHVKLPYNISRGGYVGQTFQATQWFPKPAVYDATGWHPMPYLDQGEFYSEFGKWDVSITAPENYIIAASGIVADDMLRNELKKLGRTSPLRQKNYTQWDEAEWKKSKRMPEDFMPPSSKKTKTWHYTLDSAHDFAWFASKSFMVRYDSVVSGGRQTDLFCYYNPWDAANWDSSMHYLKRAVAFYSKEAGAYPYPLATVVAGNASVSSGGMEYPTITLITVDGGGEDLDVTIAHEVGHNWFYGILASDERKYPWMDEGINSFYEKRYTEQFYAPKKAIKILPDNETKLLIQSLEVLHKDQAINLPSAAYTLLNYGTMVYGKTPYWLQGLSNYMGAVTFDSAMQAYFKLWQFKHPQPDDFKQVFQQYSSKPLDSIFMQLEHTGTIFPKEKKMLRPALFFNLNQTEKYQYISLMPALGYNYYDKLMAGVLIDNYQLPPSRFQFFAAPMYSTGSKTINGNARMSYHWFANRKFVEAAVSGTRYTISKLPNEKNETLFFSLNRVVPSVKFTWYPKDALATSKWILQAKSFILNKDAAAFISMDTNFIISKKNATDIINQVSLRYENRRALYPYNAQLILDQGKDFIRAGFTGNYFLQYGSRNESDGVNLRFFAGKFFYLTTKNFITSFNTSPYQLTLTGPRGNEDYTYSGYYIGRNEFDGWNSQQILERDGFFKVGTDLLGDKVGKTDNWLMAVNLSGNIPTAINPLSILPIKIPLKFFLDFGTYSDVWKDDFANSRFLYDAGLQISIFGGSVNMYLPLLYSKVYGDYFKSVLGNNRFSKTIAFDINLQAFKKWSAYSMLPF